MENSYHRKYDVASLILQKIFTLTDIENLQLPRGTRGGEG